ncbi:MAG TPA: hypothetical protein VJO12_03885 [Stellaceae bacterium]|nr:hypothetical protein [Stellaceae bacterium]
MTYPLAGDAGRAPAARGAGDAVAPLDVPLHLRKPERLTVVPAASAPDKPSVARRAWLDHPLVYAVALLLLLFCLMPPDGVLSDNEENYFQLATQAVSLSPASPYTAVFDGSHHRAVSEVFLGGLVKAVGYEHAQIIARTLAAIAFAFLLTGILRRFGLSLLDAVLVIVAYALLGQTLMGGEWLFSGVEAKVISYCLVLAGLYMAATGPSFLAPTLLFAQATYFHFLVGGFWFFAAMAGRLIEDRREVGRVLASIALFLVGVAPLFALIGWSRLGDARALVPSSDLPSPDVIYSIIRAPWHAAPFLDSHSFLTQWLSGCVAAAAMLVVCIAIACRPEAARWKVTTVWLAGLLGYLLVALAASFFDRHTGMLGKLYLFRPAALTLLLWLAFVMAYLATAGVPRWTALRLAALAVLLPIFLMGAVDRVRADRERAALASGKDALVAALAERAAPGSVVLIDPQIEWSYLDFERRTGHPSLVAFKFMPTNDPQIVEWYRRMEFRRILFEQGCTAGAAYPVDFLLTTPEHAAALTASCGPVVYATDKLALLRRAR